MIFKAVPIGRRIHVIGNSNSGKSTLGAQIAEILDIPFVELDAINWQPNWVGLNATDPDEFVKRLKAATASDTWVAAGSYKRFSRQAFWPQLETMIWLDLPRHLLLRRAIGRSFRRWWTQESLWGTNTESIWTMLRFWHKDSLLWWIYTQHDRKRREQLQYREDPELTHVSFLQLSSVAEINQFVEWLKTQTMLESS